MSDLVLNEQTINSVVQLARATGDPKIIQHGNIPFAVIPADSQLVSLEKYVFNEHAAAPERTRGTVTVLDSASFVHYWAQFFDPGSMAFASETTNEVVGVLDYHIANTETTAPAPRWCQHRVVLKLRHSAEWTTWLAKNNKQMTQMELAEFLEQNAIDISDPSPAAMLDVARDLEGSKEVEFGSGSRMSDGQIRFRYTETTKATVGGGQVTVPNQFVVALPVFVGGPRIPMQALFRYRIKDAKLVLWYTLVRTEDVVRMAFMTSRDLIASELGITIINGAPA